MIYNPLKAVCMAFKPRRFKLYCPTVAIGDECLKYVDTFKYLGFVFSENKKDDADMLRQLRLSNLVVDMCGVEGKRRLCDLNVTSLSPALATRHIRIVLLVNSPNKLNLLRGY